MTTQSPPIQLPHEIYDAEKVPVSLWLIAGIILAILALGLAIWYFLKRKKPVTPEPQQNPWDLLNTKLNDLDSEKPEISETFFELSVILRDGVELATAVPAGKLTLSELKTKLNHPQAAEIFAALELSDLVKFADRPTNSTEARELKEKVKGLLAALREEGTYAPQ